MIENKESNKCKGIIYFNLNVALCSICFLLCQIEYTRNPKTMQPLQLVLFRSIFSTLTCLIILNVNIKKVMFDGIPRDKLHLLIFRSLIFLTGISVSFYIVKYISLVF